MATLLISIADLAVTQKISVEAALSAAVKVSGCTGCMASLGERCEEWGVPLRDRVHSERVVGYAHAVGAISDLTYYTHDH